MKKIIIVALVIILAAVLAELGLAVAKPQANVSLSVAPASAKLTLDGQKSISPSDSYLAPGKHQLVASLDGFASTKTSFTVKPNRPLALNLVLNPNSETGDNYLQSNPDQEQLREQLGGQKFNASANLQQKLYPIINQLPYDGLGYNINYGQSQKSPNNPSKIALYIGITDNAAKTRALNWIKFEGFNPSNYEIIYKSLGVG